MLLRDIRNLSERSYVGLSEVFSKAAAKKYLADESATLDIKLKVDIAEKKRSGNNVIGYLDNGAPPTVNTCEESFSLPTISILIM